MPAPNLHPVLLKSSVQSKQNQTQPPGLTFNIKQLSHVSIHCTKFAPPVSQGSYWKGIIMLAQGRTLKSCFSLEYWHRWTTVSPPPQESALLSLWFSLILLFCIPLLLWMLHKHFFIHESKTKSYIDFTL